MVGDEHGFARAFGLADVQEVVAVALSAEVGGGELAGLLVVQKLVLLHASA